MSPAQELIFEGRIDTPAGSLVEIKLEPRPGGSRIKKVMYMVAVDRVLVNTCQVGLVLDQGPDGRITENHSTPIALNTISSSPKLLQGTANDSTMLLGEYLHPILTIDDTGTAANWAWVRVYEIRKPF